MSNMCCSIDLPATILIKSQTALTDSQLCHKAENTKRGSITVPLTSCLTGLDQSVLQIKPKLSVVIPLIPSQSNRRSTV